MGNVNSNDVAGNSNTWRILQNVGDQCPDYATARGLNCSSVYGPEWYTEGAQPCDSNKAQFVTTCRRDPNIHTADIQSCCLGVQPTDSTRQSCDPTYNMNNSACDATLTAYCTGENSMYNQTCQNWGAVRPELLRLRKAAYCAQNLGKSECRTFFDQNPDLGDNVVSQYCQLNPDDEWCSCYNSPVSKKIGLTNPPCYDSKCQRTGYKSSGMRGTCPDVVDCSVQAEFNNAGVMVDTNLSIQQNCAAAQQNTNSVVSAGNETTTTTPVPQNDYAAWITNNYTLFLVFLLFVFISIITILLFFNDDGK